jgi:hypothetical protein
MAFVPRGWMSLHRAEDDRRSRRRGGSAARGLKAGLLVLGLFGLALPVLPAGASTCVSSCTIWNPAVQPTGQMLFNDGIGAELGVIFTTRRKARWLSTPAAYTPPVGSRGPTASRSLTSRCRSNGDRR